MKIKKAAVAIILHEGKALFIRRMKREGDPWSGDIGFPGGMSKENEDLFETALREAKEEIGIDLSKHEFMGYLPFTSSKRVPELKVRAFIFKLNKKELVKKNEEVDEYYWIPLKELKRKFVFIEKISQKRIAYVYDTIIIWGLTYKILNLLKKEYPQLFNHFI